jgi:hypothetical protein
MADWMTRYHQVPISMCIRENPQHWQGGYPVDALRQPLSMEEVKEPTQSNRDIPLPVFGYDYKKD